MPKKLRELKKALKKAGFSSRPGKGSHTVWSHPLLPFSVILSGKDSSDAQRYQEHDVQSALEDLKRIINEQEN